MERFVILARERFNDKSFFVGEIVGYERAISETHRVYHEGSMNKVVMVNEEVRVEFSIERKCRCLNVGQEIMISEGITGFIWKCQDCGLEIHHDGWKRERDNMKEKVLV